LLEPETSRNFHDEFIDLDIDASQVFWVLTANSTNGIPPALLSRMAVYEVPTPTPEQAAGIAQRMYGNLLRELNLQSMMAAGLCSAVLERMASISPREMRKALLDALGVAVAGKRDIVTPEDFRIRGMGVKRKIGF
jgi:ATP-dependent Lon protease